MLPELNIRAAATPQNVNRLLIFIAFSSFVVGLLFSLLRGTSHTCCPLTAHQLEQGTCQRQNPALFDSENAICAIGAQIGIWTAQVLRGPAGMLAQLKSLLHSSQKPRSPRPKKFSLVPPA
jgi:hypothetical protein